MSASRYAARTDVPTERSRVAIERLLVRYGAERFAYGWEKDRATLAFTLAGRTIRIVLPLPDAAEVSRTPTGRPRSGGALRNALAQAERQRWRALELVVHAKLERSRPASRRSRTSSSPGRCCPTAPPWQSACSPRSRPR